jgi:acyl dehydratase
MGRSGELVVPESFTSIGQLESAVGRELGPTSWRRVDQSAVDVFAEVTDDHNWIHVDTARAAEGPFGATIAHGYFTLSLIPSFGHELYSLDLDAVRLNYGMNKVRFPQPVPTGSRIRARVGFIGLPAVPAGRQLVTRYTIEIEGQDKPACVAETVVLLLDA